MLQLLFSAVCLCPGMDRRVLSICRRRLPDKTKQLFEWSHVHYNKSAIIPPSVHLQMSPSLHRWDIFAPLSVSAPFHLSVRWQHISNMDRFAQTLVGRLVVGHEVTDWCSGRIWRWTGTAWQWHAVDTDLCSSFDIYYAAMFTSWVRNICTKLRDNVTRQSFSEYVTPPRRCADSLQSHVQHLTQRDFALRAGHELWMSPFCFLLLFLRQMA